jgi:hypothetical protein
VSLIFNHNNQCTNTIRWWISLWMGKGHPGSSPWPVAEIHFFRWGGQSLLNFRQTPPPFALEKTVFSPLLVKISENSSIFREGGGEVRPPPHQDFRPTKISDPDHDHSPHQWITTTIVFTVTITCSLW